MNKLLLIAILLGVAAASDPVKVDLYFEGLCPGCHAMILTQLYPTYQKVKEIMDINLYAYGNARYWKLSNGGYAFQCQHGPAECKTNMIITCFQHYSNSSHADMEFTNCMVGQTYPSNAGPYCVAKHSSIKWDTIDKCISSTEGMMLEVAVAEKTGALVPPHQFVPWPVVDGVFTMAQYDACSNNMLKVVCDKYTGTSRPAACDEVAQAVDNRCYKESTGIIIE